MILIHEQKSSASGHLQNSFVISSPCQVTKNKIKQFLANCKKLAEKRYEEPLLIGKVISNSLRQMNVQSTMRRHQHER